MAKSYKIIVTPYAEGKLKDISTYLLENASYEVASKVLNGILDSIDSLEKLPQAHPKEQTKDYSPSKYENNQMEYRGCL